MCAMHGSSTGENQDAAARAELNLFDRNPDPALDELTELAAVLCNADYAYVGWMDLNRLWFKSRFGFKASDQPRAAAACQWVLEKGEPLLIADAGSDARFPPQGIPLAGAEPCLSFAAAPLYSVHDQAVGVLAVLARQPGRFNANHLTLLDVLGRQAITRLELYKRIRLQERAQRLRQRTEHALAIERCFVEATLDAIPALVAVLDTAGRLVRINHSCAQLTGLSLASIVGRPFVEEFLETGDRVWASEKLREAAVGAVSGPHETLWQSASAGRRSVSWTLRPLAGPGGEIQYLIVTGQDVTGQREIEQALLTTEVRYREAIENSLGFVLSCTMDGRLTSLNAFTAETLGYSAGALVGRKLAELMDAAGSTAFADCLNSLESHDRWRGALPLRRSDGVYRRIAVQARRMQLPGEQPFALLHGMDVTEQYATEEALRLATRQRELILEAAGDGICGIDLDGQLTFINQAGAALLGYSAAALAGRDLHELIRHSHADGTPYSKSTSPILQALRRAEALRVRDDIFWRKDGTGIPVEYSANPLVEDGRVSGMVVAFQDVSESRRLERMKDEFISTVSHELRTPLTSLRAALGLIHSGTLDKRPEKQQQMIALALENCDRLVRLVNDIVDFDRGEKGGLVLNRHPVAPDELLLRAADVAHSAAVAAGIGIRIQSTAAPVLADPERILQVLNELIANAIKFSTSGSAVRLIAHNLPAAAPQTTGEVCFAVEDQGCGIAPEILERIFERFEQGDGSDTRSSGGTGLGLALCRSIVEQHGGRIWAESQLGRGSRFLFTLPAAEVQKQGLGTRD